jgi:selenocysteine lyase/cysteine desulfurase
VHRIKDGPEGFEDGTVNFLGIAAIPDGLDFLDDLNIERIDEHVTALTEVALEQLTHPGIILYGPKTTAMRGGTIAFNIADRRGGIMPFEHVEAHARAAGINIRGGCFCNPGAAERAFAIPPGSVRTFAMESPDFSPATLRHALGGAPLGALRCSFGVPTNRTDIARLADLLRNLAVAVRPTALVARTASI